jgi:hypothetical protein
MMEEILEKEQDIINIYNDILKDTVEENDTNYEYENGISEQSEIRVNKFISEVYNA